MFDSILDNLFARITGTFNGLVMSVADYVFLGEWVVFGLAALGIGLALSTFFPFVWVRASLGFAVVTLWAFIIGLIMGWRRARRE